MASRAHSTAGVEELLAARERKALLWTIGGRLCSYVISAVVAIVASTSNVEISLLLLLLLIVGTSNALLLWNLSRGASLRFVGTCGVIADALVLLALPLIWHFAWTSDAQPLAHLARHSYTPICLAVVALNTLALRPLYPVVAACTAFGAHIVLAVLIISDPRLARFEGGLAAALGTGQAASDLFVTAFFVAMAGSLMAIAARSARALVKETALREYTESRLLAQQLQTVLDAKLLAVSTLVAGMEHEVNSPLGAMRSSAETSDTAITRLQNAMTIEDGDKRAKKSQRLLNVLRENTQLTQTASDRLSEVMARVRGFVQLDRGNQQDLDLGKLLGELIAMHRAGFRDDTRIETALPEGVTLVANGAQLSQALSTVLKNAGESLDEPGVVSITLESEEGSVRISIRDTGRGMSSAQVEGLLEVGFAEGERVHARLGLPLCRSIVHRHGGEVRVDSTEGQGTVVTIEIPRGHVDKSSSVPEASVAGDPQDDVRPDKAASR